jgi:hypothetical protein
MTDVIDKVMHRLLAAGYEHLGFVKDKNGERLIFATKKDYDYLTIYKEDSIISESDTQIHSLIRLGKVGSFSGFVEDFWVSTLHITNGIYFIGCDGRINHKDIGYGRSMFIYESNNGKRISGYTRKEDDTIMLLDESGVWRKNKEYDTEIIVDSSSGQIKTIGITEEGKLIVWREGYLAEASNPENPDIMGETVEIDIYGNVVVVDGGASALVGKRNIVSRENLASQNEVRIEWVKGGITV